MIVFLRLGSCARSVRQLIRVHKTPKMDKTNDTTTILEQNA